MLFSSRNWLVWLLVAAAETVWCRRGGDGDADKPADPDAPASTTSVSATSTSTTSSATPSPSMSFTFTPPSNTTTCDSTTFFWSSSGVRGGTIALYILSNHTAPPDLFINQTLTSNVSVAAQQFSWLSVVVPQGFYVVTASQPAVPQNGVSVTSPPFFVQNGSDVSCLVGIEASESKTTPASAPTISPYSHHPIAASPLTTGSLIGTIVGAIVAVIVLAVAFRYPRWWRRALPSPKTRRAYILY